MVLGLFIVLHGNLYYVQKVIYAIQTYHLQPLVQKLFLDSDLCTKTIMHPITQLKFFKTGFMNTLINCSNLYGFHQGIPQNFFKGGRFSLFNYHLKIKTKFLHTLYMYISIPIGGEPFIPKCKQIIMPGNFKVCSAQKEA